MTRPPTGEAELGPALQTPRPVDGLGTCKPPGECQYCREGTQPKQRHTFLSPHRALRHGPGGVTVAGALLWSPRLCSGCALYNPGWTNPSTRRRNGPGGAEPTELPTPAVRTQPLTRTSAQVSRRCSGEQRARAPQSCPQQRHEWSCPGTAK